MVSNQNYTPNLGGPKWALSIHQKWIIESKKDLKSRIINVYENDDSSKCLKSRVLSILEEEKFNTPNIHAAMLKNFLQNLPEPLLIPGYKKIFKIITGKILIVKWLSTHVFAHAKVETLIFHLEIPGNVPILILFLMI